MSLRNDWLADAACKGHTDLMFDEEQVQAAREFCRRCPVRGTCAIQALQEEQGAPAVLRYGIRGYLTPAQRESIEKRGGLKGRDPIKVVHGRVPIPDQGDLRSASHSDLGRRVVAWLVESVAVGEALPSQAAICRAVESCTPQPLRRVMEALMQDGTIERVASAPGRRNNGATLRYIRRGNPAVAEWRPPHLAG